MEYREFLAAEDKQFRAHLEEHQRVVGGLLDELKTQGERIIQEATQVVKASGQEAVVQAQASLDQVGQAAQKVVDLAERASETTQKAAQQSTELLGKLDLASKGMVTSEQNVEAALDALLPKVVGIREGLEKELGDVVRVTAATEAEIKKMVASIHTSMTKEIENEIRTRLHNAATQAAQGLYGITEWWSWFSRIGVHVILIVMALSGGVAGWWFGQHQMRLEARQEAIQDVGRNITVRATAYSVVTASDGGASIKAKGIREPLVVMEDGSYRPMKRTADGKWSWGKYTWNSDQVSPAMAWDDKTNTVLKTDTPE